MTPFLQLLLLLAIIIAVAKAAGALARRAGQPAVFGEILAGLVLGPTVLDLLAWPVFQALGGDIDGTPGAGRLLETVRELAELGVLLLMFVAGLETDLGQMRRVGTVAFWVATGGVVLPLAGGLATAAAFGIGPRWEGLFIGTILTATSVSISAQTLIELGVLRSKEGSTILGAAVIDDVMGILVLSLVVAFSKATGTVELSGVLWIAARIAGYFGMAVLAGMGLPWLMRRAESLHVTQGVLASALVVAFVYAWAAEVVGGVAAITGAYVAGVLIARTPMKAQVDEGIHPLTYSLFVPVFFISIGLQANGRALGDRTAFTLVLVAVAIVTKALGSGLCARLAGFTTRQATRVGAGMISRGEVGLIVAGYGLTNGLIGREVFSATIVVVLATTMVTPPLLRLAFGGPGAVAGRGAGAGAGARDDASGEGDRGRTETEEEAGDGHAQA